MGLKLRYNFFRGVEPESVYAALWEFYARRSAKLIDERDEWKRYELFEHGRDLDQFIQSSDAYRVSHWFPGRDVSGNASLLAAKLGLREENLTPYLVREPDNEERYDALNVPTRPGDKHKRFDECAVLDFLSAIGVATQVIQRRVFDHLLHPTTGYVSLTAPVWKTFRPVFP